MTKDDAVVKYQPLALATMGTAEPAAFIKGALVDMNIGPFGLSQIRVPAGGALSWEIDALTGKQERKELEVVIAAMRANLRKWYREPFGQGQAGPPNCSTEDGITGLGVNTLAGGEPARHECATCAWNQWGSSRRGGGSKAKDCSEYILAAVIQTDALLPDLLSIPASSIKALQQYGLQLMKSGKAPWTVVTKLRLERETEGSLKWSVIAPEFVRDLSPDERAKFDGAAHAVKDWLGAARLTGLSTATSN